MPRIALLPEELTNQIAAGEVIERPASVVKELVENSLDAGAARIDVDVEQGGLALLRVTDDGVGMAGEDAELSLLRHATSKLRSAEDLFHLTTMGFRGEALASVGAVSRLQLTTRVEGAVAAYRITLKAGNKTQPSREVGGPVGTQIEVRDLFWNVPVRRKFMKTEATETGHISETLLRLALAHPGVHFRLRATDKTSDKASSRLVLDLPPHRSPLQRSTAALRSRGKGQVALYLGEAHTPGVTVSAHVAAPEEATTTARNVFLLVNRRFVRDRGLLQAVVSGYGELLEKGRYPMCVLHVQIDLESVDVNVHPQKLEVRFANPEAVFDVVQQAIRKVCVSAPWLLGTRPVRPTGETPDEGGEAQPPPRLVPSHGPTVRHSEQRHGELCAQEPRPSYGSGLAGVGRHEQTALANAPRADHAAIHLLPPRASGLQEHRQRLQQALKLCAPLGETDPSAQDQATENRTSSDGASDPTGSLRLLFSQLPYLGQLFGTYLLCEHQQELLLIDQHAAHERVIFERLRRARKQTGLSSQRLLFPVHVALDDAQVALVGEFAEALRVLGYDIRTFAERTVALLSVPDLPKYGRQAGLVTQPEALFRLVLDELEEHGRTDSVERRDELLLATMACHAAVRAGDVLSEAKARALFTTLDDEEPSPYCPHGRPVLVRLSQSELERRFLRA